MFDINSKIIEVIKEINYEEISFLNSKVSNLELAILITLNISQSDTFCKKILFPYFSPPRKRGKIKRKDSTKGGTF